MNDDDRCLLIQHIRRQAAMVHDIDHHWPPPHINIAADTPKAAAIANRLSHRHPAAAAYIIKHQSIAATIQSIIQ